MFKKSSKRNLRQRKEDSDDEKFETQKSGQMKNGDDDASILSLKDLKKKKDKEKKKAAVTKSEKKSSLLSFGVGEEEDEAEIFQLKKSSRSRRIAKQIKKMAQEEREKSSVDVPSQYSREYLEELRKASIAPQSLQRSLQQDESEPEEEVLQNIQTNGGFSELRPGEIPDANRIHAARKQREMMRKYGADYIPVENTDTVKKATNSRLVREDEFESTSGEDEGPSVAMKGIIDDGVRVVKEISRQGEGPLNRDEEFDTWEAEMIKKGLSTQQPGKWANEEENLASYHNSGYSVNGVYNSLPSSTTSRENGKPKTVMSALDMVADVKKRISDRLESLDEVHRRNKMNAERAVLDVKDCEDSATNLSDVTSLSKQYTHFQDMRAYVRDLIDCLNEKAVEIEALESRRHKIWKDRADMLITRRQQDITDESSDITASLSNGKAAQSSDPKKQTRIREREARRSRRRSAREKEGKQNMHIDGMSTDEEVTSMDIARNNSELEKIMEYKASLFDDVVEEFHGIQVIVSRFSDWKKKYADSYNDAYIGLCVPRLLVPFIRLAILNWNPLERDCVNFEEMKWYNDLLFFGSPEEADVEPNASDSDTKALSILFERAVLPKLRTLIQDIWDPLSRKQSQRLCLLLSRLVRTYPCMQSENRKCNELLLALCTRMQQCIDNDIFIPLYPTSFLTDLSSGPGAYFERQTWTCVKLYENILIFNGLLSPSVLHELAFTSLLNRYIMLALQTSPITTLSVQKCQRIADAIPPEWLREENIDGLAPHLASYSRYLLHSAKHIHAQLSSVNDVDKRKAWSCISQLGKLLSYVGADDLSMEVMKLLGIKTLI